MEEPRPSSKNINNNNNNNEATPSSLDPILQVAQEAALLAGKHIRLAWSNASTSSAATKGRNTDLVTETDQHCEELVLDLLKRNFPSHCIIGEETSSSSSDGKYRLTDAPTWTIDPIDGTTNFVHKLKLSCVIISFLLGKEPVVGVIYDPYADELFWAVQNKGAFCTVNNIGKEGQQEKQQRKIHVSNTESIPNAVVSMDPGYSRTDQAIQQYSAVQACLLQKQVRNIRVLGSTGLNMAYVACGRMDAAFEEGTWEGTDSRGPKIWDFSAGRLLVTEAGGVTRNLELPMTTAAAATEPIDLMGRSFFCAATPTLAEELMRTIQEGRSRVVNHGR